MHKLTTITLAALLLAPLAALHAADAVNLRCEYLDNPLGIDVEKPQLSWVIEAEDEGGNLKHKRGNQANRLPNPHGLDAGVACQGSGRFMGQW